VFDECAAQTVEHFDARRVFKIIDEPTKQVANKANKEATEDMPREQV